MRKFFGFIFCLFLFFFSIYSCCPSTAEEQRKDRFSSYLEQFTLDDNTQLDEAFFKIRKQFPEEKWCPELCKFLFSSFLPCGDDSNCVAKKILYRPCYRIESVNYHLVSIFASCYFDENRYVAYDDVLLLTYSKTGEVIDFEVVGTSSLSSAFIIDSLTDGLGAIVTQYNFTDVESYYVGDCNVATYKVTIDEDGNIDKCLIREEKNVHVNLLNHSGI
jgi:hypothetical protein